MKLAKNYDRGYLFTAVTLNLASAGLNIYLAFRLLKALNYIGGLVK